MKAWWKEAVSRRLLLTGGALLGGAQLARVSQSGARAQPAPAESAHAPGHQTANLGGHNHDGMITPGRVDYARNGFDPHDILTDWDTGVVSRLPDGRTLREFQITAEDKEIEIAPGLMFPAWTYNGRVPGPTLRVSEGDRVRVRFRNFGSHPHSIHFHGIHAARMDGVPGAGNVGPGGEFVYEFDAFPFGCHLYHCHSVPLKRHIHKGLYGAFIIDPDPARRPEEQAAARSRVLGSTENAVWQEFVLVMNAFDTNFDEENEVYAVNSIAHAYTKRPIAIARDRPVRLYLINVTEFDPINSLHLHANFFDYFDHGTTLTPTLRTVDTVMQCQGQRGILEFSFKNHEPGRYMFHAHQSEFAELGWMSLFDVRA
ncbi:MAG: multicopper oxidase domain-containing protein [Pseudomonadota bacterium]|nr:multicopper oxidase domain-containing protein [Pseudomonadota bacterium]